MDTAPLGGRRINRKRALETPEKASNRILLAIRILSNQYLRLAILFLVAYPVLSVGGFLLLVAAACIILILPFLLVRHLSKKLEKDSQKVIVRYGEDELD